MSYDIVVRFPDKETADKFCGQMSDGFGEGFCDFSFWAQHPNTDGTKQEHFYKEFTSEVAEDTPVYFVKKIFEI